MTDTQNPQSHGDHDATGWLILGAVLIVAGFFLGARQLGWVSWPLSRVWGWGIEARSGIGIVAIGVLLIVWAQSGKRPHAPTSGTKLYRSRQDKWLAGVLGGLANYFGFDVTLFRLLFLALVLMFDVGGLILAYIVMAIVVPLEPEGGAGVVVTPAPAAPAWPAAPAAPVAPAVPAAPAAPAPSAPAAPVAPAAPEACAPVPPAPEVPAPPAVPAPGQAEAAADGQSTDGNVYKP